VLVDALKFDSEQDWYSANNVFMNDISCKFIALYIIHKDSWGLAGATTLLYQLGNPSFCLGPTRDHEQDRVHVRERCRSRAARYGKRKSPLKGAF